MVLCGISIILRRRGRACGHHVRSCACHDRFRAYRQRPGNLSRDGRADHRGHERYAFPPTHASQKLSVCGVSLILLRVGGDCGVGSLRQVLSMDILRRAGKEVFLSLYRKKRRLSAGNSHFRPVRCIPVNLPSGSRFSSGTSARDPAQYPPETDRSFRSGRFGGQETSRGGCAWICSGAADGKIGTCISARDVV